MRQCLTVVLFCAVGSPGRAQDATTWGGSRMTEKDWADFDRAAGWLRAEREREAREAMANAEQREFARRLQENAGRPGDDRKVLPGQREFARQLQENAGRPGDDRKVLPGQREFAHRLQENAAAWKAVEPGSPLQNNPHVAYGVRGILRIVGFVICGLIFVIGLLVKGLRALFRGRREEEGAAGSWTDRGRALPMR